LPVTLDFMHSRAIARVISYYSDVCCHSILSPAKHVLMSAQYRSEGYKTEERVNCY